jgi:hypothetical protein
MKMSLRQQLNELGEIVSDLYPDINHGGCCVYASLVAQELLRKNVNCSGIVTDWYSGGKGNIDEARPNIKSNTVDEWESNGVALNHVALEFSIGERKYHYDTSGVKLANRRIFKGQPLYGGRLNAAEMMQLASRQQGWNRDFRRKDIPIIRKLVKFYLKD